MSALLAVRQLLRESRIENRDQLKTEKRLYARKHHAALLEQMSRRVGER
jgi:hypothetical protein